MANLLSCTVSQLDEIIRVAVVTNPWSDVEKFPDMKQVTVIRTGGFANAEGDPAAHEENKEDEDEEDIFRSKKEDMRQHGFRIVTGEEYSVFLRMKNRPTIIPLWMPIIENNIADGRNGKGVASTSNQCKEPSSIVSCDDDSDLKLTADSCQSDFSMESIPTILSIPTQESCTDSIMTFSPEPKRIKCGTRVNCMEDEETDASNAVTVQWARA